MLKSRAKYGQNSLKVQVRPVLMRTRHSGSNKLSVAVDELYWERQLSAVSFVFLGRKKIVNGVAVGRNPSNFFDENKAQDRLLNDADRRAEIPGDDMVGLSYFGRSYTIQSLVSLPEKDSKRVRALLQLNSSLGIFSTDVIAYYAKRPALGLNISTVLGENTILYAETAVRKGRDRLAPVLSGNGTRIDFMPDNRRWISDFVIGAQYTMPDGINLSAEYWRNNNGFAEEEFARIFRSLTFGQGSPRVAGALLGTRYLRRNSAFFRVADIPLHETVKGEMTWIRNIDDGSRVLRGILHWDMSEADSLRIGMDWLSGAKLSEYGSAKVNKRVFLHYKRHF